MKVIGELRAIFARYYIGDKSERAEKVGSLEPDLTEAERDEQEFVATALKAARIQHPKNIRRYFAFPDAALPSERTKVVERIARRIRRD